jgi:hypothetical protein
MRRGADVHFVSPSVAERLRRLYLWYCEIWVCILQRMSFVAVINAIQSCGLATSIEFEISLSEVDASDSKVSTKA